MLLALAAPSVLPARAQEAWTLERCMQYAVEHNHDVRLQQFSLDDARAERLRARGSFLPSLDASGSAQFNFGRAIDPETPSQRVRVEVLAVERHVPARVRITLPEFEEDYA